MPNMLDRFSKVSTGKQSYIIDYLYRINVSGDFEIIKGINAIVNSWLNILTTSVGTVDHDPEFGCGIQQYLFKPLDSFTANDLKDEIKYKLMRYDNRARIEKIDVSGDVKEKQLYVEIYIIYKGKRSIIKNRFDQSSFLTLV